MPQLLRDPLVEYCVHYSYLTVDRILNEMNTLRILYGVPINIYFCNLIKKNQIDTQLTLSKIIDKIRVPTHALFIQHYISLAC